MAARARRADLARIACRMARCSFCSVRRYPARAVAPVATRIVWRGMMKRPRYSRKRGNCGLPVASAMLR